MQTICFRNSLWSMLLVFLILCQNLLIAEGFIAGTLVLTPAGFRAIETLHPGDEVISRTLLGKPTTAKITKVTTIQTKNFIELIVEGLQYFVDSDQKFYLEGTYRSRQAHALCCGDILVGVHGQKACIEEIYFWNEATPIEIYALSVTRYHNFCVGTSELITHNLPDCSLMAQQSALIFAAGGGFVLSSPAVVAIGGASLLALAISLLAEHIQERNKNKPPNTGSKNSDDKTKDSPQFPQDPKKDNNNHPNGIYADASYHHKNSDGRKNPAPKNGQKALDNSVQIDPPAPRRIGVSESEIVILDRTMEGVFHGHVRTWSELIKTPAMQSACNVLIRSRLVDKFGKIL